jgi:hypothetical protein
MAEKNNPANEKKSEGLSLPKGYRPMSVGQRRLEVPPIDGYHLHWFRGTASNLARAHQAGYTFVDKDEVSLNDFDIAGDGDGDKGTDLGTRVSVISGDDVSDSNGQAGRLYLMKCRQELYEHAQGLLGKQVDLTAEALRGGNIGRGQNGEGRGDSANRYLKEMKAPLLTRKN